jgi:F-type H+-transporting ATPase subunit gamma
MGTMREIKQRIYATKKTSQITKAMHMVSASKLKKAEKSIISFRPLTERLDAMLTNIFNEDSDLKHPMLEARDIRHTTCILITSDRGLAGPYNANVFKTFESYLKKQSFKEGAFSVAAIGSKAFNYVRKRGYPLVKDEVTHLRDDAEFIDFRRLSDEFIKQYLSGETDQIIVFYNQYINTLTQVPKQETLVPLAFNTRIDITKDEGQHAVYDFEPSIQSTLQSLIPNYVVNTLYGFILEAKASEHAARMTAMKNATDNAEDLIHTLTLSYNKARQDAITIELTDIIGGANAVN